MTNRKKKTFNINKKTMGIEKETGGNGVGKAVVKGISKITLNAIETAILKFVKDNRHLINENPYQWFAVQLGYKKRNTLYEWFYDNPANIKYANNAKIGLRDIKELYRITRDENILNAFLEECRNV